MKEFFFQNILIADISKKVAKWQQFTKGLNVVTGIDNHVGKSSLLKSLFYALGADVAFDSAWDQNSKLYVATINVNGNTYRIARFSGRFAVFHDEELLIITDRISSELAPLLERIFEFAVYLPNKDTKKVELAPPTFTFMPYYIDQDRGWSGLYNSFKSVARYKSNDRIKSLYYHLSIYTKTTVELMSRKDNLTEQIQTSVYKGYKRDKIEMRGDRAEISDFPLYLNTVAGGLDCRDQTIGGFSFVVKIYAVPVVEIIG